MDGRLCWFILQAKPGRAAEAAGYIVDFVHLHWLDKAGATHTWPRYSFTLVLYIIRAVVERMLCMVTTSFFQVGLPYSTRDVLVILCDTAI